MKETIIEEWDKILQEIINKCIDVFKARLRYETEVEARHIEQYFLFFVEAGSAITNDKDSRS